MISLMSFSEFISVNFHQFWVLTGFANVTWQHGVMLLVGLFFIWLAIKKNFEPMLLVPIGFGILLGNIPFNATAGLEIGIYEEGSVLNILYNGVSAGWYPPLIFLGIGAMTDFSALIANPKLMLIGAAAQFGIFGPTWWPSPWILTRPGRRVSHHRRRRRSYSNLPLVETCAKSHGSHRRIGLFLHGSRAADSAANHAPAHHKERACDTHEARPRREPERENHLPHYRPAAYLLCGSLRHTSARHALLRQPAP